MQLLLIFLPPYIQHVLYVWSEVKANKPSIHRNTMFMDYFFCFPLLLWVLHLREVASIVDDHISVLFLHLAQCITVPQP